MFMKVCDLAVDCKMCMTELGTLLRKLGKFMIAFNKPSDAQLTAKVLEVLNRTKSFNADDEERALIPTAF